jgi:hypothetical protein
MNLLRRLLPLAFVLGCAGCHATLWQASFVAPERHAQLDRTAPFVKAHTATGNVYVLSSWRVDVESQRLLGEGLLYDASRKVVLRGKLNVPFERIALLETNRPERVNVRGGQYAVMTILTGASLAATVVCAIHPAACFWTLK